MVAGTKAKKGYSRKEDLGICRVCGVDFKDDIQLPHRKYICRKCWNYKTKMQQRKIASTLEGYFTFVVRDLKNVRRRNIYPCEVDLQYLLTLFELQGGRCAISNMEMTWGFEDNIEEHKIYRRPFNASIDRIDSTKGYTKDNVILICNVVNFFKGNYPIGQMYNVADTIVRNKDRLKEVQGLIKDKLGVGINI